MGASAQAIADIIAQHTSTIDWSAWEAIGTVGALWFAVIQAGKARRAERLKYEGVITTLIGLIEPVSESFYSLESETLSKLDHDLLLGQEDIITRALNGLSAFTVNDFASAGISEWAGGLPLALEGVARALPGIRDADAEWPRWHYHSNLAYVDEANTHFHKLRDISRYGRILAWGRSAFRRTALYEWLHDQRTQRAIRRYHAKRKDAPKQPEAPPAVMSGDPQRQT
jgi:hypothetical protein